MSFQTHNTFIHRRNTNLDILMKSESFLSLHRHNANEMFEAQKGSKDIVKIVSDVSGSTLMLRSYENTFLRKENENNDFLQQFLLFYVSLCHAFRKVKITITVTILASTPMHNNVLPLCSFKWSSSVNLDGFWLVSIIYHYHYHYHPHKIGIIINL